MPEDVSKYRLTAISELFSLKYWRTSVGTSEREGPVAAISAGPENVPLIFQVA